MLNQTPNHKQMNWRPKNDTIGVPGKGFIKASDFSEEDLLALIARAENRNQDVHSFLLKAGLEPVRGEQKQTSLFEEERVETITVDVVLPEPQAETASSEAPKKRGRKSE